MQSKTLGELAEYVGGRVVGHCDIVIRSAATPGIDANTAKRTYSLIEYLPEIRKNIRTVEKRLARLEKPAKS